MIRLSGAAGVLTVAGRPAVELGAWTARGEGGVYLIDAAVLRADPYWAAFVADGCSVALHVGTRVYRWRAATAALTAEAVSIIAPGKPAISQEGVAHGQP